MSSASFTHYLDLQSSLTQKELSNQLRADAEARAGDFPSSQLTTIPTELDVVFSGGGFKNCYSGGVCLGLEYLRRRHGRPRVMRFAGTSAGAHMCYVALNDQYDEALSWAYAVVDTLKTFPYMRPWPMWTHFFTKMSEENALPPPHRLHVSLSKLSWWPVPRFENEIVSSFHDPEDLTTALLASGSIPLVLCPGLLRRFRNASYLDGAVTNNTPVFTDEIRPQLVVRFDGLPRTIRRKLVYFSWEEIIQLIHMGISDAFTLFGAPLDATADGDRCAANLSIMSVEDQQQRLEPARASLS